MIRIFKEHPEFDEFTKFDTDTGRLVTLSEDEFRRFLPKSFSETILSSNGPIHRINGDDATIFLGETPETHTRFPRRIYFQITRNCNLRCDYCFLSAERGAPHVPTSAAKGIARFMGQNGLMEVRLTGGEPTTHPEFFDILRAFQEEEVYVSVATNGVMDRRTLDQLAEEDNLWVICSIDGNRETHNRYRHGTFDQVLGNMKYLKAKNPTTRLRLTTVLTKENKSQMYELGEICKYLDAESITLIPLRPQVRDSRMRMDMINAPEFRQVIEDLVRAKERLGIKFTTTIETDYAGAVYKDPVFRKRSSCAAGREGTNLDYDAAKEMFVVYGCAYSPASDLTADPALRKPFLAGEFSQNMPEAFLGIWRDEQRWTIYRDLTIKADDCKHCTYYDNHTCVGSCPIQNIDYSSINAKGDVLVQLRKQIESTAEHYCYQKIFGR